MEALKNLFLHCKSVAFDSNIKRLSVGEFIITNTIIQLISGLTSLIIGSIAVLFGNFNFYELTSIIIRIVFGIIRIIPAIKRCHDVNWSGRKLLWMMVPIANIYVSWTLYLERGKREENVYGEDSRIRQEEGNENYWKLRGILVCCIIIMGILESKIIEPLQKNQESIFSGTNELNNTGSLMSGFVNTGNIIGSGN